MAEPGLKPAQMRLILSVARHGQLQRAAEELALTQPAASRMLTEVERTLRVPLFHRHAKGMTPTEAGALVFRRARAALYEIGAITTELDDLKVGRAGSVRVGSVTGPAVGVLVPAIRTVKREAPGAAITVDVAPSRQLIADLVDGRLDFALARILPEHDSRLFDAKPMQDERVALLVRAGHPLARAGRVTLTELHDFEWVMQERGAPIREAMLEAFAGVGLGEPRDSVNSSSLVFTIGYLARSDAIAPVSREVAELLHGTQPAPRMAELRLQRSLRVSPYFLLTLRARPLSPLAERLRDAVLAAGSPGRP